MLSQNKITEVNGWCYLLTVLTSILLLVSCVPTTLNTTGTTQVRASDGYAEIKEIENKLSVTSEPTTAEMLIEKSKTFIKVHPKYNQVDEVYYILGTALVQFDRPEEGIEVLEELIKYYPRATSVEPSMLTLGLAYDKINRHDKADVIYGKLVNTLKYSSGKYAKTARQLLQTDKSDRKGALEGLSDSSGSPNFIGQPALDFQVTDLNGQPLSLEKYKGQVVLLDFWATWCGPCLTEMPNVKRTYQKYKNQKFQIIGISLDRGKSDLESYIEKEKLTWPQYYDSSRQISNMYQVRSIPSTFLIDGNGIIRKTNLRGNALEYAVAQLVQENMSR
jgi:peroxiredoxin